MTSAIRIPFEFATVPKLWPGETVVCIGGGPSLTPDQVDYCRGKARVIAINDAYRLAPWADLLYACDARWWEWHKGVPSFTGPKYALQKAAARWPGVQVLKIAGGTGLERKPHGLRTGRNSGYQAINLAVHLGCTRVILIGYDMQKTGNKEHWFGSHPNGQPVPVQSFRVPFFSLVEPLKELGIEVVNCSRETSLFAFPRRRLEDVL